LTVVPGATSGGCIDLGFVVIDSAGDLFGMFAATPGGHTLLCAARIGGSHQFLAALFNSAGAQLGFGTATLTQQQMTDMFLALKNGPASAILALSGILDTFNGSGDNINFAPGTPSQGNATPQTSVTVGAGADSTIPCG
jgi:hypothetical protein